MFNDPNNPNRTARTKVLAIVAVVVTALYGVAQVFGVEIPIPEESLVAFIGMIFGAMGWTMRDAMPPG